MAKQLYGYDPNSYGDTTNLYSRSVADTSLLSGTYRYLGSNSLPLSTSYNPESYSSRIAGISGSHGPPGVDTGASIDSTNSLYPDLKRTSETLYHQTQLDAYNTTVQPEAWYSTTPLTKRPRYHITSQLPVYPQRPGQQDCAYYMQSRTCMYGEGCRFHHPFWVPEGGIPDWKEGIVPGESLPERPGEPDCPYFVKTQKCKFGVKCKFNHPKVNIAAQGDPEGGNGSIFPERPLEPPCTFYMKTGQCKFGPTCKFHHPKDVQIQSAGGENGTGLLSIFGDSKPVQQSFAPALLHNSKGLPIRRGEDDCPFYLKTGSCKYGATCRYNHPEITASQAPILPTPSSTHFNLGFFNPAPSILPSYVSRLHQTPLEMASTVYPQRVGEPECDFYMKTGICKFGVICKFHHPIDRSLPTGATEPQAVKLTPAGLARREGAVHCPYYMKTGTCKYGATCKFDHPPPAEILALATSQVVPAVAGCEVVENKEVLAAGGGEGLEKKKVTSAAVGKCVEYEEKA